jgi:phage tail protein X
MNRYEYTPIISSSLNVRYYRDTKYPDIPLSVDDIYVITTAGDRFDLLAKQYYSDDTLWWIISSANNGLIQNSLYIPIGTQLRIPTNINEILNSYKQINS